MKRTPRLLLIDEDRALLDKLAQVLREAGYDIVTAQTLDEALDELSNQAFDVVIADEVRPDRPGVQMLDEVNRRAPATKRIMLTGQQDLNLVLKAVNEAGVFRFLTKPWDPAVLRQAVAEAVDSYEEQLSQKQHIEEITEQVEKLREQNRSLRKKVLERTRQVVKLNQSTEQGFAAALQAMARLTKLASHSRRVADVAKRMATYYGVNEAGLVHIELAASLHDIGKIRLPDGLINKPPQRLTDADRKRLEMHPINGEQILLMAPNMEEAARLVRHHHEWYDGSGYPDRLDHERIPLGSRIIAIANAYDHARFSQRTPLEPMDALKLVQNRWMTELDPHLVEVLGHIIRDRPTVEAPPVTVEVEDGVAIDVEQLRPSMILTRDLVGPEGVVLIAKDRPVARHQINQLLRYHASNPLKGPAYIRPGSVPAEYNVGKV